MNLAKVSPYLERILQNRYLRNVGVLAGGTLFSQIILSLTAPILTRLYTPSDFGVFGLFVAYTNIMSSATMAHYETAVVSAEDDREAAHLIYGGAILALWISFFSALLFVGIIRLGWWGFEELPSSMSIWVFVILFTLGIYTALRAWQVRQSQFRTISQINLFQNVTRATLPVGLGMIDPTGIWMVISEVIGRVVGCLASIHYASNLFKQSFDYRYIGSVLKKYYHYPLFGLPSIFLNRLGNYIAVPLIAGYFGVALAGQYALVVRIMSIPASLIGASVADVFHNRMSEIGKQSPNKAQRFMLQTALLLAIAGGIPVLLVTFFGPSLYNFFFGGQWQIAGEMAQVLAFSTLAQIMVSPLSRIVYIYGAQRKKLIYDTVNLITMALPFPLGAYLGWGINQTLLALSLGQVLAYAIYFLILWNIISRNSVSPKNDEDRLDA